MEWGGEQAEQGAGKREKLKKQEKEEKKAFINGQEEGRREGRGVREMKQVSAQAWIPREKCGRCTAAQQTPWGHASCLPKLWRCAVSGPGPPRRLGEDQNRRRWPWVCTAGGLAWAPQASDPSKAAAGLLLRER